MRGSLFSSISTIVDAASGDLGLSSSTVHQDDVWRSVSVTIFPVFNSVKEDLNPCEPPKSEENSELLTCLQIVDATY